VTTNYDAIAEQYKRSKLTPWRRYIEQYTFFEMLGDVRGLSVLDLACGEGFYARLLKLRGAARVVGIDLSAEMIRLARRAEADDPLGVEYVTGDAIGFRSAETFDVVTAAYLLNYAESEEALAAMCRTIAAALTPGGRFVTVNNNPSQSMEHFETTRSCGFIKSLAEHSLSWLSPSGGRTLESGATITYTVFLENGETFHFDNYYLSVEAHERALTAAGFGEIEWVQPMLSPDCGSAPAAWNALLVDSPIVFLRCRRIAD
jgi:2-polyprenyl-3-methyl-5-hydroxy-6-metoxy-1,4-benzoquinol methylase